MIIENSNITMRSESKRYERYEKTESLTMWFGGRSVNAGQRSNGGAQSDMLQISEQARNAFSEQAAIASRLQPIDTKLELGNPDKERLSILQIMLEALTGKKMRFLSWESILGEGASRNQQQVMPFAFGMQYSMQESYVETEKMSFNAEGVIRTADGKEITFSVNLNMSRSFAEYNSIEFRAGGTNVIDPLVINYSGSGAALSQQKFSFDLTMDGIPEQISMLKPGSGFLALDLNGDGKINDGSELFGPSSGNGFDELAEHDADGNGWIDANDPVYEKLAIWIKDDQGNDQLLALGAAGIGAIYLGNVDSQFDLKDDKNQLHGQISRTGIYVKENGTVGTVQQVDLAI